MFINELLKAVSKGQSSDSQGGYYFPGDLATGALTYTNAEQAKFDVKDDLLRVVKSCVSATPRPTRTVSTAAFVTPLS